MRRKIGKEYSDYEEYLNHQKVKTTDPVRREKWLGKEWQFKIDIFKNQFQPLFKSNVLNKQSRCLCLGARTGQEVVALQEIGCKKSIGIDIVPQLPYVKQGDIHNVSYPTNTFDFTFTNIIDHSIYPNVFVSEMERVLKPGGYALVHLQLNCKSDEFAENDVHSAKDLIELFTQSTCVKSKQLKPTVLSMNWMVLMQKQSGGKV